MISGVLLIGRAELFSIQAGHRIDLALASQGCRGVSAGLQIVFGVVLDAM